MKEGEEQRHRAPAAAEAVVEEADLLREVSRPDDEELRKCEVRPEHREGQKKVSVVMHVAGLENSSHRPLTHEEQAHEERERHARDGLAADHVHAVDCRVPVRVERHEEVDRGDRDEQAVDGEAGRRDELHPALEAWRGRVVLLFRKAAQRLREDRPQEQADGQADREEGRVHVGGAVPQDLVARNPGRIGPRVEMPEPEKERDREESDERERARRRLEDATDDEAPRAARHVVEHRDREASQGHAEDEDERHEVRAVELGGVQNEAGRRDDAGKRPDDEAAPAENGEIGAGGGPGGFGHFVSEEEREDFLEGECPVAAGSGWLASAAVSRCSRSPFSRKSPGMCCEAWSVRIHATTAQRSSGVTCSAYPDIWPKPFVMTSKK